MNKNQFISECLKINIKIDEEMYNKLYTFYKELNEWNKKFNLTTILEEKEVFLKHFYDSLTLVKSNLIKNKIKLCDFGTGAGFPGMVIAIVYNNIEVTLIESNNKKCLFLQNLKEKLNLKNVEIICDRAEIYAKTVREEFDITTCRAVSSLDIIFELGASLTKVGGHIVFLKSSYKEELSKAENKIKKLGFILENIINFKLPYENSERNIIVLKKINITPIEYPRDYKMIKKHNI